MDSSSVVVVVVACCRCDISALFCGNYKKRLGECEIVKLLLYGPPRLLIQLLFLLHLFVSSVVSKTEWK